jgi:hypothetical protein
VALHTRWAWHLKDRIDRRFVAHYKFAHEATEPRSRTEGSKDSEV